VRDDLLDYYERELTFLRQMGAEFAEKYPKIASRLQLEADRCEDPHVERLIEGFAFLAGRVHLKIDDEFPEVTEALLGILFPHYTHPIPAMSVVEFHLDPEQGKLTTGLKVPRGSLLYSRPVDGVPCRFRTCYDTTLWPLTVAEAQWTTPDRLQPPVKGGSAVAALRFDLACLADVSFDKLALGSLRFYLSGESNLVHALYELLLNNCAQILVRDPANPKLRPIELPAGSLRSIGFGEDEAMLPYTRRSFAGYRLLQEYFAFPEKFFFIELAGLEALAAAGFRERAQFVVLISPFERADRSRCSNWALRPRRCERTRRPSSTCSSTPPSRSCWTSCGTNTPWCPTCGGGTRSRSSRLKRWSAPTRTRRRWRSSSRSSRTGTGARGRRNRPSGTRSGAPRPSGATTARTSSSRWRISAGSRPR